MREKLTERGLKVFVVPEVPTLTMEGGGMVRSLFSVYRYFLANVGWLCAF